MSEEIDINQIMQLIPHRYPFLLVDKVINIDVGNEIIAIKNVTINEPQFLGHFPTKPILPGVLTIEAMAQAAGILVAKSQEFSKEQEIFFMSIDNVKFRKPVVPGDVLILNVKLAQQRGQAWKFTAVAKVEEKIVAEAHFMAMVQKSESKEQ